jgi:GntR family transcriptional regulator
MVQYLNIASQIKTRLEGGILRDGDLVAPEADLGANFGDSRTTVRAALRELEREHLVRREKGRGTFFRSPLLLKNLGSIVDFHSEAIAAGRKPETKVLDFHTRPAELIETALFGEAASRNGIVELRRLRLLDGEPAVLQFSRLAAEALAGIGPADLENRSLYGILASRNQIEVADIEETLDPVAIGSLEAPLLNLLPGAAVFRSQRIARAADTRVIEVSENFIRGDRYRFRVNRKARNIWS